MRCLCECMWRIFKQSGSKFANMSYAVTISKITATLGPDCLKFMLSKKTTKIEEIYTADLRLKFRFSEKAAKI